MSRGSHTCQVAINPEDIMVRLENSDTISTKKSKKRLKKKIDQESISVNTENDDPLHVTLTKEAASETTEKKCENDGQESRKSKKKKRKRELADLSNCSENTQKANAEAICKENQKGELNATEDMPENKKSKKKKRKRNLEETSNCLTDEKVPGDGKIPESHKPKKKKQVKEQNSCLEDSEVKISNSETTTVNTENTCDDSVQESKNPKKSKKKKLKKKTQEQSSCPDESLALAHTKNENVTGPGSESLIETKKSKKRKKPALNENDINGVSQELADPCNVVPAKKRKKDTNKPGDKENVSSNEERPQKVKKKKCKKVPKSFEASECMPINSNVQEDVEVVSVENGKSVSGNIISKKRKKKSKNKDVTDGNLSQLPADNPESHSSELKQKVKRKKKSKHSASPDAMKVEVTEECTATTENDQLEVENDVTSKSLKKKLKATEDGEIADSTQAVEDDLGQWKTAELSSSAHEKFARLLGARKKRFRPVVTPLSNLKAGESVLSKLSGVWKPPPERTLFGSLQVRKQKFAKMAMDRTETTKLNECLETQFVKTLDFNLQKRKEGNAAKGLGFQEDPAKGKKHYIDIHKVKSVTLD